MNQDSSSQTYARPSNSQSHLLPENVKGNPHMFRGWREGIEWALVNPRLLEKFELETGTQVFWNSGLGLGAFISPEIGLMIAELALFVDWYNRRVWMGDK